MNRKKIAILITGEIRTNSLGKGTNTSFVDTFKKNILNEDILNNYDVNIYFVSDKTDVKKTYEYFGEYLKDLLELSFQDIDEPLNLNLLIDNYLDYYNYRKNSPEKFPIVAHSRESQVYTFYKLYAAYTLMKKYESKNLFKHDYILRLRPDSIINSNLYNDLILIENNDYEILFAWDVAYLGKYDIISHICNLIFIYGKYNYGETIHDVNYTKNILMTTDINYLDLAEKKWSCWSESPEVQLLEHVIDYCYKNNINYNKLYPYFNNIGLFNDRHNNISL